MNLNGNAILASILVSSIGFILSSYGYKMKRAPQLITGIALLVYPYFVGSAIPILCIAPVLLLLMWLALRRGL